MKRLARILLNFVALLSLALCVTAIVFWIRSYRIEETVGWYINHWDGDVGTFRHCGFDSDSGGLTLFMFRRSGVADSYYGFKENNPEMSQPSYLRGEPLGYAYRDDFNGYRVMGFAYYFGAPTKPFFSKMTHDDRFVLMPYWFVVLSLGVFPIIRLRGILRLRRQRRPGLCPICSYDLRATPDRCPECGTRVSAM